MALFNPFYFHDIMYLREKQDIPEGKTNKQILFFCNWLICEKSLWLDGKGWHKQKKK